MDWFFDGIGTLLIGLLIGGTSGSLVTWRIIVSKTRMQQRAASNSTLIQAGRDIKGKVQ